jgi:hypothetical protein
MAGCSRRVRADGRCSGFYREKRGIEREREMERERERGEGGEA